MARYVIDAPTLLRLVDAGLHVDPGHQLVDQTVQDEANAPFGGMRHSGNSARFGGAVANIEAYTDTRWITGRSTVSG